MVHSEDRAKATLRALIAFAKHRHRWPSLPDLRAFAGMRKRLGSRVTVQRSLAELRRAGLIELRGAAQTTRWVVTPIGFDVVRKPVFAPRLEQQRTRKAAATVLDHNESPRYHTRAIVVPLGSPAPHMPQPPAWE